MNTRKLMVSKNSRYLQYDNGAPFFYLADTAWSLFHCLDMKEAEVYLTDRASKGFTVIQAVVIAEFDGLSPNANGDIPFIDNDPAKPNEQYFSHVDKIVNRAEELGLFIGMLPMWGCHWKKNGNDPAVFTKDTIGTYGTFLARRYAEKPIIWIPGGDRNIDSPEDRELIDIMAKGLRKGDKGSHLITYHPSGPGQSSKALHNASWLDFNMVQSSHGARDHDNGIFIDHDYALQPVKPTLDGEPRYECVPVGFYWQNTNKYDRFDDYDCRQAAYWAVLAGACGHTYGNNNIWQMYDTNRNSVIWADIPWHKAINHPGAFQMGHLRKLFESRHFEKLIPDNSFVVNGPVTGGAKVRAAIASDGSVGIVYNPRGETITVDKSRIKASRVKEIWFDPRYGKMHHLLTHDNSGFQTYTPPSSGRGNDWILILEDESLGLPVL